jgi:hypothetical protein
VKRSTQSRRRCLALSPSQRNLSAAPSVVKKVTARGRVHKRQWTLNALGNAPTVVVRSILPNAEARMGTARVFNQILREQLGINAAWLPVTNNFALGDYGVMTEGIFVKLGNIETDFGVTLDKAIGPSVLLTFTSKGTTISRVTGSAKVDAFPGSNSEATLAVEFTSESSFLLNANLTLLELENVNQAAYAIFTNPAWEHWRYKYRIVRSTYTGKHCTIISSNSSNARIELSGAAHALKQFDAGGGAIGITATSKKAIGLDLVGASGVFGLSFLN